MSFGQASTDAEDAVSSIQDIVFSCGVCQATAADVYATRELNKGFHSHSGDENDMVGKLWIGACCHVFCGRHLEGGGLPFHPCNSVPRAACPVCVMKGNIDSTTELYSIRGLDSGEYDSMIPEDFMQCPPFDLNGEDPKLHAMRFQYHQLCHYSQQVGKRWKVANKKTSAIEAVLSKERKERRALERHMKVRATFLEKVEAKLQKWEERRGMINHYLGLVNKMAQDMKYLRAKLNELGFVVPQENYAYELNPPVAKDMQQDVNTQKRRNDSSATLISEYKRSSSSSRKRKYPLQDQYAVDNREEEDFRYVSPRNSRNIMAPPRSIWPRQHQKSQKALMGSRTSSTAWEAPQLRQPDQSRREQLPRSQHSAYVHEEHGLLNKRLPYVAKDHQYISANGRSQPDETHKQGTLFFRRPQGLERGDTGQSTSQPCDTRADIDETKYVRADNAIFQNCGLLSVPPRRRKEQNIYNSKHQLCNEELQGQAFTTIPTRILHFDPAYDSIARQFEHEDPLEQQPLMTASSQLRKMAPLNPVPATATYVPSQRCHPNPVTTNVASSFFQKSSMHARPDDMQRSSKRDDFNPQYRLPTSESTAGYQVGLDCHGLALTQRQNVADQSTDVLYSLQNWQPSVASQPQQLSETGRNVGGLQVPHILRNSQSSFQHAERRPLVAQTYQPSSFTYRPSSSMNRSRMTLPPSRSMARLSDSRDPGLSMFQGVRGGSAAQIFSNQQMQTSAYTPSRSVSSAARGRGTVER